MKHAVYILTGPEQLIDLAVAQLQKLYEPKFLLTDYKWEFMGHARVINAVESWNNSSSMMMVITHPCGIPSADLISLRHDIQSINRAVHFGYIELV